MHPVLLLMMVMVSGVPGEATVNGACATSTLNVWIYLSLSLYLYVSAVSSGGFTSNATRNYIEL